MRFSVLCVFSIVSMVCARCNGDADCPHHCKCFNGTACVHLEDMQLVQRLSTVLGMNVLSLNACER